MWYVIFLNNPLIWHVNFAIFLCRKFDALQLNALIVWRLFATLFRVYVRDELRHLQQRQLTLFPYSAKLNPLIASVVDEKTIQVLHWICLVFLSRPSSLELWWVKYGSGRRIKLGCLPVSSCYVQWSVQTWKQQTGAVWDLQIQQGTYWSVAVYFIPTELCVESCYCLKDFLFLQAVTSDICFYK